MSLQRNSSRSSTIKSQKSLTGGISNKFTFQTGTILDIKNIQKEENNNELEVPLSNNPSSSKRNNDLKSNLVSKSSYNELRQKIMEGNDLKESIKMAYDLLKNNRDNLIQMIEEKSVLAIPNDHDYKANHHAFKCNLDICCNYLLLIVLHLKNNEKKNAAIALHHLLKDTKNIFHIESFIYAIIRMPQKTDESFAIIDYLNYLSSLIKCSLIIKRNYIYEMCLLNYINFIESLNDYQKYQPYLYFYLGRIFIESDYINIAEICYNKALSAFKVTAFQISSMYNQGLIFYVTGRSKDALKYFIKSNELVKSLPNNHENEEIEKDNAKKAVELNLTLAEMEIEDKKKSFEYLEKVFNFNISNPTILTSDNKNILHHLLSIVSQIQSLTIDETSKKETKSNESHEDFVDYCMSQVKKPIIKDLDLQEFEKFFLFMTKLSVYQVELLNKEQPEIHDFNKKCSLPIYFSNGFKQSLSLEQRIELNKIKFLSLKRKSILKRPDLKIALENFELKTLYRVNNSTSVGFSEMKNITSIKEKVKEFTSAKKHKRQNHIIAEKTTSNHNTINTRMSNETNRKLPEFKHAKAFPFYSFVKEVDELIIKKNINLKRQDENMLPDEKLIHFLNKMNLEEVLILKENPSCLIDLLLEQRETMKLKQKINKEESLKLRRHSSLINKEENDIDDITDNKNDIDEDIQIEDPVDKKNNDEVNLGLDALNVGKDD